MTTSLGQLGENLAAQYLKQHGLTILDRNIRSQYGEIDLIVRDQDCLIFVEVKTRSSHKFGLPQAAVTPKKLEKITKVCQSYRQNHPKLPAAERIDVIAITNTQPTPTIEWIKNVLI